MIALEIDLSVVLRSSGDYDLLKTVLAAIKRHCEEAFFSRGSNLTTIATLKPVEIDISIALCSSRDDDFYKTKKLCWCA